MGDVELLPIVTGCTTQPPPHPLATGEAEWGRGGGEGRMGQGAASSLTHRSALKWLIAD
jgi:hypothetical protein